MLPRRADRRDFRLTDYFAVGVENGFLSGIIYRKGIRMNFQSILALAAVGLGLAAALAYMIRHRGGCGGCSGVRGQLRRLRKNPTRGVPERKNGRPIRKGRKINKRGLSIGYWMFLGLLLVCSVFSGWASMKVHSAYSAFSVEKNASRMTGYDTAVRLLRANGVSDVSVGRVKGRLTDHFDPRRHVVNLSDATYGDDSVAAVAVAAHEIGHVMQKEKGYIPYKIRSVLVPIATFGSRLALPVVLIGFILDLFVRSGSPVGLYAAYVGIALYGLSTLFTLVTLPVELDASRRAKKMLLEEGVIAEEEKAGASKVLGAAALTYGRAADLLFCISCGLPPSFCRCLGAERLAQISENKRSPESAVNPRFFVIKINLFTLFIFCWKLLTKSTGV
ncbi:MAG: zinc metallopeptidase [Christensenellaceae bacterium]